MSAGQNKVYQTNCTSSFLCFLGTNSSPNVMLFLGYIYLCNVLNVSFYWSVLSLQWSVQDIFSALSNAYCKVSCLAIFEI